jgi:catechol 2,3-dioxygenase-like lactoylglutathione lyase family enzyme
MLPYFSAAAPTPDEEAGPQQLPEIRRVGGITLRVTSMLRSLRFYGDILGLRLLYGGEDAVFSSFDVQGTYLNLELWPQVDREWGRIIFYCDDVDEMYTHLTSQGYHVPPPKDAPWGERFFHIKDPDGHELSMAQPFGRSKSRGVKAMRA